MPFTSFPKCRTHSCDESAVSFSELCWGHASHETYSLALREALKTLAGKAVSLNLKKVECEGLDFSHLDLKGSSFSQAHFTHTQFIGTDLSGSDMIGAQFKSCDFVGGNLSGANLTRSVLTQCSFSYSDLRDSCLAEAHFKETDVMGALLCNSVIWNSELSGAKHLKKKNFNDPEGGRDAKTYISEANALVACESYRALKHYLYQRGLYEDASWASYKELTMERQYFLATRNPRYLPSLLMDILSGYAEKPSRVIVSSLALVGLFGLAYFFLNVPTVPSSPLSGRASLWDSLYFSFITFTTVGYGDLIPRPVLWFRLLACAEAFSGPFMAGLYIFTLTRRYSAH